MLYTLFTIQIDQLLKHDTLNNESIFKFKMSDIILILFLIILPTTVKIRQRKG